jgi:hypothetical protein
MSRVIFQPDLPITPSEPNRTDVACFVGLVRPLGKVVSLPDSKRDWLRQAGWLDGPYQRNCDTLFNVPVPIENFAAFQQLFDDGSSADAVGTDYLALAVQSYFAQGGKRCYVVRMGDPVTKESDRSVLLQRILFAAITDKTSQATGVVNGPAPVDAGMQDSSAQDQGSWHGIAHLWGLPDVSFLVLPDLPVLHAGTIDVAKGTTEELPSGPERFVRCVPAKAAPNESRVFALPAPRLTPDDYSNWRDTLTTIIARLTNERLREVQLVAAMPLPFESPLSPTLQSPADSDASSLQSAVAAVFPEVKAALKVSASSAFLQIAFPWVKSTRSGMVLEGLEPPDGTLAGILARNALLNGTFNNATKITPVGVFDIMPQLPAFETEIPAEKPAWNNGVRKPLVVRFSLFGFTPSGVRLLSDVTTFPGEAYRPARVNRLVSLLSRAARLFGENHVFEQNGPALWSKLEDTLRLLLTRLWQLNALEGATPAEAFEVHCDRSTMTQNDIDNGRMIAVVSFTAAATLELITVTMTVEGGSATTAEVDAQLVGAL